MILDAVFEKGLFQIRRPGATTGRDALGRPTKSATSWGEPVNGILSQSGTAEGEAFVVNLFRATMPLGTDLREDDEVLARGLVYTVEGTPFSASPPGVKDIGIVTAVLKYVGPIS